MKHYLSLERKSLKLLLLNSRSTWPLSKWAICSLNNLLHSSFFVTGYFIAWYWINSFLPIRFNSKLGIIFITPINKSMRHNDVCAFFVPFNKALVFAVVMRIIWLWNYPFILIISISLVIYAISQLICIFAILINISWIISSFCIFFF